MEDENFHPPSTEVLRKARKAAAQKMYRENLFALQRDKVCEAGRKRKSKVAKNWYMTFLSKFWLMASWQRSAFGKIQERLG